MINASTTPPVPAPRTKIRQRMNSTSAAGNSSSISDAPSSTSHTLKPKSIHPWMTLVHSGPWTQLPPAPAPVTPPASSWFRPRVPPRNPFGEPRQTKPSEENIPSINADDDQQNNSPDAPAPLGLSDADNSTSRSDQKPASAEKPIPPKRQGSKDTQPPASDSIQRDESTDSSSPSGERRTADNANVPAANTVSSTEVTPGVFHFSGTVSGDPECEVSGVPSLAEVAGLPHLSDPSGVDCPAGAVSGNVGIPDMADVGGGGGALGAPDLAGAGNPFEVPDLSDAAGGLGMPDIGGESGMGALGDLAAASGGLGEFAGKGGLSGLEVPDLSVVVEGESPVASEAARTLLPLTQSVSVPAIFSTLPQSPSTSKDGLPEGRESASFSKACKENPFDRKPGMPKSKTFQTGTPPPKRSTAPGYGFPLIKRKVQTDSVAPVGDLEVEMGQLDKQVETLDLKGMELEKRLRNSQKDEDEEKMLIDWLTLVREKNVLVRRDTELVYLTKQQHLEVRQADVEYGLRCLLNKPESDWSQEDRGREQQLMDELVTIIEQRNHIISSLDLDRQSEREEDLLFEAMMKRKDFQREGLKELKKSKGKFKLMKVMKMLSQKTETAKDSKDKKKS